ncbi:MAG: hypothetical protein HC772_09005 [Leptolyngbyaceae cyanobacterium CRU_2_3]|nr:hypothetical protein [Leptolyngbyaceae cyanobacterium CRU_2_3]
MNPADLNPATIDCETACVNGCRLGENCPNLEFRERTSKFIQDTPLDQILAIAEEALRRKSAAPTQWVFPEDGIPPNREG